MSGRVELEDIHVRRGSTDVLRGIDLAIAEGERASIIGPSGVGKTTLLRALMGLTPIEHGRIRIDGVDVSAQVTHQRKLGVVFQEHRLLPHLTAIDNIALPLRARRMSRARRREIAGRMLERVELSDAAAARPHELSGGELQRVALARALVREPTILLLDEPLSAVDPSLRAQLQDLILRIHGELGTTMLIVTHDRTEAAVLGTSIAVLLDGRIQQCAPPEQIALRPVSVEVAVLTGAGIVVAPGTRLHAQLALPPDELAWIPTIAISPLDAIDIDPCAGSDTIPCTVTASRFSTHAWTVTLDAIGTPIDISVAKATPPPNGTVIDVVVDRELITRFPEEAQGH